MALGGVQQGIAQALLESLNRDEPAAITAAEAREALPALRTLLADPDWWVRHEAAVAIRAIDLAP